MPGLNNVNVSVTIPPIETWFSTLNSYASNAINSATAMAQGLVGFTVPSFTPNATFDSIGSNVTMGALTKPRVPTINTTGHHLPAGPSLKNVNVSLDAAPTFYEPDPSINMPNIPDPLSIYAPVKDFTIDTSIDLPIAPDTTLPSVPTLLSLNIPTPEAIAIPIFDHAFPTSNSLVIPGITFSFTENEYSDALLTKVKDTLINRLNGGTGLPPLVEMAIWNRGRDRESKAALLAERTLLDDRASAGFSRPTGAMNSALDLIIQDTQSKLIDLSREIMIKQAELEQENIKTSIQQAISLEDILIRESQAINQRRFEAAKYIQDLAIEIFKVAVNKYNAEVEAYKAFATAYHTRVQAELSKIEIFKAQIDAEKLKGDINEQNIKIYLARIEGIKSNVEVYKTLISAVSEKLKAESLKIDVYKGDIEAYTAQVKAKAEEYSMYSEQIKGEMAKVNIFESKVKAFASRIQAYASTQDVKLKKAESEIKSNELNIKKYEADIEAFIKQVQADQMVYQAAVDLYKGEANLYMAEAGVNKSTAELALKNSENIITQNKYKADISVQNAQIALESAKVAYNSALEGMKAAGSIHAQIASSALSAINVSAGVQGQASVQAQENHNYSDQ